ncbi:hypothetical protein [Pseudomonas sp. 25 R 14]|uniref:hypothetical protein n=1 Tax=Pseudomonas sp. 25 R 14 TaxID=1844109 RepID=UPI00081BEF34|nr:hypothetical protein [Pseudomonas sp. 25 R 14]
MYTPNSCHPEEKVFYRPIDAAIRWCNLMAHEAQILESAWCCPSLLASTFPQWPCLHLNTEKIFDAVRNQELPCGVLGATVAPGTPFDCRLLTVRHIDLKGWMHHHYPDQRPAFLFGTPSPNTEHISYTTYLTLRADRDALHIQLKAQEAAHRQLLDELNAAGLEREQLHALADAQAPLSERSQVAYSNTIGALVDTLLGVTPAGKPNSVFNNQAAIVDSITAHHGHVLGLSKRSLDQKFAAGRRSLAAS